MAQYLNQFMNERMLEHFHFFRRKSFLTVMHFHIKTRFFPSFSAIKKFHFRVSRNLFDTQAAALLFFAGIESHPSQHLSSARMLKIPVACERDSLLGNVLLWSFIIRAGTQSKSGRAAI